MGVPTKIGKDVARKSIPIRNLRDNGVSTHYHAQRAENAPCFVFSLGEDPHGGRNESICCIQRSRGVYASEQISETYPIR